MTFFRCIAYLSPLLVGFGLAGALALTWERPVARRLVAAGGVLGGMAVVLVLPGLANFSALGPVLALVATFALLVTGVFCLCASFRLPPQVCQIVASLVVVLLVGSVFIAGPAVAQGVERGMGTEEVARRINLSLDVNPFMTMGYSVFDEQLLHTTSLYSLGLADYLFALPEWGATSLGYLLTGVVLIALAFGLSKLTHAKLL